MDADRRQIALLGAILAVLASVLYWQFTRGGPSPAELAAAAGPAAGPPSPLAGRGAAPAIPAVAIAALGGPQPEPADTGRDPFRFGAAPVERPTSPAPMGRGGPGAFSGAGASGGPPVPTGPPPPPPITLKFIGTARQGTGRLYAVLRDERGVYYGADGDVVEGRYKVLRVSADAVDVSYLDGRGRVSIPLSGGRPEAGP